MLSADIATDPYGLKLRLDLSWDDAPGRQVPVELGIGTVVGRIDDFENPNHGWTHEPIRTTAIDQWNYGPDFGVDEGAGFKYGYFSGGYLRGSDAVLTSPPVLLSPNSMLLFDQVVAVNNSDSLVAEAGGVIEISVNGGDWQTAFPEGGYPTYFRGQHLEWQGRPIFSQVLHEGAFHPVRVDLSQYSGSIRIRFRFFAESGVRTGDVWRIDNVVISDDVTPVRVLSMESRVAGEDVHLEWRLAEPLPATVRILRGPMIESAEPIGSGWFPALENGAAVHAGGAHELPTNYWLEGLDRDGSTSRWGPWHVASSTAVMLPWQVLGNPSRKTTQFSWANALPSGARLEIYDVTGRLVFESALDTGTGTFAWEGQDGSGRRVKAGIYFARITETPFTPVRIVRLP